MRWGRLPKTSRLETPGALPNAAVNGPRFGCVAEVQATLQSFLLARIKPKSTPLSGPETSLVLVIVSFIASISPPTGYFKM